MRGVCRARNEEWRTKYGSLYRKYVGRLIIREGERESPPPPCRIDLATTLASIHPSTIKPRWPRGFILVSIHEAILFTREACLLAPFLHLLLSSARVVARTIVKCLDRGWMGKGKPEFFQKGEINSNKVWIIFSRTRKYLTDFGTREKINPKSWPIQQFLQIFSSNAKRSKRLIVENRTIISHNKR